MLRLLAALETSSWCQRTVYIRPSSLQLDAAASLPAQTGLWQPKVACAIEQAGEPETGLVVFLGDDLTIAIIPPFPVAADIVAQGAEASPLVEMMERDLVVGTVLLRLGRYAVGVLQGDSLVASKTASRYVKARHRAGGSSQRRFERSRERLVRELFDKTCEVAQDVFAPYGDRIEYVLMGGERHTLNRFIQRCRFLRGLDPKTLKRRLHVEAPNLKALERAAIDAWRSSVLVFADGGTQGSDPAGPS